jgi:acyl-CoA thioester hydrolase
MSFSSPILSAPFDPAASVQVFEMAMPIRWGDMDAMGHVNNTVYFRYLEQTRISWFDHLQISPNPQGQGPIIVNAWCNFVHELRYPGDIVCKQYLGAIGRSSFDSIATIVRADEPDKVYAVGGAKVVWVDFPKRKSAPLPTDVLQKIQRPWR